MPRKDRGPKTPHSGPPNHSILATETYLVYYYLLELENGEGFVCLRIDVNLELKDSV